MWRIFLLASACSQGLSGNHDDLGDLSAAAPGDLAGADLSALVIDLDGFSAADLSGVDFSGVDLSGVDFSDVDFSGVDRGDATTKPPADLAGVDFNIAGFCLGTLVEGTCVQSFFAPLAPCFAPSGACVVQTPTVALTPTWCWPGGDELKQMQGIDALHKSFQSASNVCFTEIIGGAGPSPAFTAGGQTFVFSPTTGNYTCLDGSKGSIGANFGGCAQLAQMLAPDTTGCTHGTCL